MESSFENDKSSSDSDVSFGSSEEEESFDDEDIEIEARNNNDLELDIVDDASTVNDGPEEVVNEAEGTETRKGLVWKETKLFPPDRRRSDVWKFGGFAKDEGGNLIKDKVICSLCGKKIHYANSPTNFRTHLIDKHGSNVKSVFDKSNNQSNSNQPKITLFGKSTNTKKYKSDHPKQVKFRKYLQRWIIKQKRPLRICEDEGFRNIMELADNQLSVPSRRTITNDIKSLFKLKRKEIK